jgi:hypothetical protein
MRGEPGIEGLLVEGLVPHPAGDPLGRLPLDSNYPLTGPPRFSIFSIARCRSSTARAICASTAPGEIPSASATCLDDCPSTRRRKKTSRRSGGIAFTMSATIAMSWRCSSRCSMPAAGRECRRTARHVADPAEPPEMIAGQVERDAAQQCGDAGDGRIGLVAIDEQPDDGFLHDVLAKRRIVHPPPQIAQQIDAVAAPFGIVESHRSGRLGLRCDSQVAARQMRVRADRRLSETPMTHT